MFTLSQRVRSTYHVVVILSGESEGEGEVKILQCLLRFPVHICRAGLQKKGTQRSSADCDINWGNWVNGAAETAELLYPKDMLKSLCEAWVCIAGDMLPTLLRFFIVFNLTAINDGLLQILLHFLHKQLKTLYGKLPLQPLPFFFATLHLAFNTRYS